MVAEAEPIYWPDDLDDAEEEQLGHNGRRIVHLRHRIGEYEVTRLILDPTDAESKGS